MLCWKPGQTGTAFVAKFLAQSSREREKWLVSRHWLEITIAAKIFQTYLQPGVFSAETFVIRPFQWIFVGSKQSHCTIRAFLYTQLNTDKNKKDILSFKDWMIKDYLQVSFIIWEIKSCFALLLLSQSCNMYEQLNTERDMYKICLLQHSVHLSIYMEVFSYHHKGSI